MEFLVESYLEAGDLEAGARLAPSFPDDGVKHLRTIVIPEDETVLLLYEAPSADAVRHALELAGITCDRVTQAVES